MSGDIEKLPQEQEKQTSEAVELFREILNEVPKKHVWVDKKGELIAAFEDIVCASYDEEGKEKEDVRMCQEVKVSFRIQPHERVEAERYRAYAGKRFGHFSDEAELPPGTVAEQLEKIIKERGRPTKILCIRAQLNRYYGGEFPLSEISEELDLQF